MHGCIEYESEINKNAGNDAGKKWEEYLMNHATLILPVSSKYGTWLKNRFPNYKDRIGTWTLGYDFVERKGDHPKQKGLILVAGGNTPQKNNNQVSDAVARLDGVTRLEIYGLINPDWPQSKNAKTYWMGQVPNDLFLHRLCGADIFIVN